MSLLPRVFDFGIIQRSGGDGWLSVGDLAIHHGQQHRGVGDVFYIDLDGHRENPGVAAALTELAEETFAVKVLGSYPKAVL